MLSPSVAIRCRGVLGLLNLHHLDYVQDCQEAQFYNPLMCKSMHGLPGQEPFLRQAVREHLIETGENTLEQVSYDVVTQDYHNPLTEILRDGTYFKAYESALRIVEFELYGPQNNEESFVYPVMRLTASMELDEDMEHDMVTALKFHKMDYEADVLKISFVLRRLRDMKSARGDPKDIHHWYLLTRLILDDAVQRWPGQCYFYYATIRFHAGPQYVELATKGLQCADCTPHLERQIGP